MKKLLMVAVGAILLAGLVTGCAKKEEDMVYLKDFDPLKYVELGEYKGLTVEAEPAVVDDAEVDNYIAYITSYYAENKEVTDRDTVQLDDIANIDYVGKKDGVAFDGGTAEGYDLTIGSGAFIPGFEDGIVGMKVGETKDLDLTFPENYNNADLAGAAVVFTVTVNSIKENIIPEFNDELVQKIGEEGITTTEQFKEKVRADLLQAAEDEREQTVAAEIQKMAQDNCKFIKDAPSGFVDRLGDTLIEGIQNAASSYGMDAGTVASYYYGIDAANYQQGIKDYVKEQLVPQYLMVGAIAKAEGIEITDADVDEDIKNTLEASGSTATVKDYKDSITDMESYKEYLMVDKVLKLLSENAVVNEK